MGTTLAQAYVQIIPSAKGIKGSITNVLKGEANSAGTSSGQSLGSSLVGKLKGVIAAAGIGAAFKASIQEGAQLEQTLGGIETLFKNAADTVKDNAARAWQTSGVSGREYMDQATSFSAALISSLGGDVQKAAGVTDMAIRDMADNSNKMGTSMRDIQNAYQGFAKQNYTMLDNLKLGYGGTKTEMQRLLADATKLTGVKYDISNLSDVFNAIHAIQENLGITGTTALEAEHTISGSFNAMKAAAMDFLGNLALGENVTPQLENLIRTAITFAQNLIPAVVNVLTGLPPAVFNVMKDAFEQVKGINWIEVGTELITKIDTSVRSAASNLWQSFLSIAQTAGDKFKSINWGQVGSNAINLVKNAITTGGKLVSDGMSTIGKTASEAIKKVDWAAAGKAAVEFIAKAVSGAGSILSTALKTIGQTALTAFKSVDWAAVGKAAIDFIKSAATTAAPMIVSALKTIGTNAINAFKSVDWKGVGKAAIDFIKNAISGAGSLIVNALKTIGTNGMNAFKSINWGQVGRSIIDGIVSGVKNAASSLYNALKNLAKEALQAAKDKLKIGSPSKVFRDQIGKWIPEGIAAGISGNMNVVESALGEVSDMASNNDIVPNVGMEAYSGRGATTTNYGGVNINVYAREGQSARDIAEQVSLILNQQINQQRAVFA